MVHNPSYQSTHKTQCSVVQCSERMQRFADGSLERADQLMDSILRAVQFSGLSTMTFACMLICVAQPGWQPHISVFHLTCSDRRHNDAVH